MDKFGFIYVRDNAWYILEKLFKMGIASFTKDRESTYITGEVERGEYVVVFEIPFDKMRAIDSCLKHYFKSLNIYKGGGTEFYNRCIIDLIEPYLKKLGIKYRVLTKEEIILMNRNERVRNIPNVLKNRLRDIIQKYKVTRSKHVNEFIQPNKHQQQVLEKIEEFFGSNNIGKIVWACGLGKALLSILIIQLLKFKSVAIGVPSNYLQKQIKNEILKIFPNKNNILFVGSEQIDGIKSTTDKKDIKQFLSNETKTPNFVITTYHSCYLLVDFDFEFKIGDEAHHLVGIEKENVGFRQFHNIKSSKTLFMTATEKIVENKDAYSMDDESIFGKNIDNKSVHWSIENKKITDYNLLLIKNKENEVDEIIRRLGIDVKNKDLFIAAYMCLKSFEKYEDLTHVLLYTNTTDDAELSKNYLDQLLSMNSVSIQKEQIYNNSLHSKNRKDLESEVYKFKNSTYGIISCVHIFGEGFDLPKLNGVCIAGNMKSETRIVQYLLRPNRLDSEKPNKKAYIIVPYIDTKTENITTIALHMRNVDENVHQKIILLVGQPENREKIKKNESYIDYRFEENSDELNKLKLRLRYSKALGSDFSEEQDEYYYVRSINSSLRITSPQEYVESRDKHWNFISSPEEYFKLKGVWNNWYDFIGVDTLKFIQSKQEWINFCKEKNIGSLEQYYRSCELHDTLPKEPVCFYKDFTNIPCELGFNRNRR